MERQVIIHLAGGIAEAIHRGERRKREVLRFAKLNCSIDVDLKQAAAVLANLRRLNCRRYDEQHFALLAHGSDVSPLKTIVRSTVPLGLQVTTR